MRTQAEIDQSLRATFPTVFGTARSVDDVVFDSKFESLLASAGAATGPFLSAETVRYQLILLLASLFLISLTFFRWGQIKILDQPVTTDRKLLAVYAIFVAVIGVVFAVKAYVDVQRMRLTPNVSGKTAVELQHYLEVGLLKKQLQHHFWTQTFDAIGRAYGPYREAQQAARGGSETFTHIALSTAMSVDIDRMRTVPELVNEITLQEHSLSALTKQLDEDIVLFRQKADPIVAAAHSQRTSEDPFGDSSPVATSRALEAAYADHLESWLAARNALASEGLKAAFTESQELRQLNAMLRVLESIRSIRLIYSALEVGAPLAFAAAAIWYGWPR